VTVVVVGEVTAQKGKLLELGQQAGITAEGWEDKSADRAPDFQFDKAGEVQKGS
jgi:hypothetical protein